MHDNRNGFYVDVDTSRELKLIRHLVYTQCIYIIKVKS